ncbi:MBL fold metallo-hydrolase [Brevundimonas kwangchunensis]|uniref:MBL fold metallo-hydrolase n=1 Tax=Brevundimonas kwangchunensis TaxID=322163 RepID=A0ABN1GEU3_9CAUL
MNVHARLAAASLMLMTLAAACSPQTEKTAETAPAAPAAAPISDTHAFRIGQVEAVALRDGTIVLTNAEEQSPWSAVSDVATVLTANGVTDNRIHLSVQPLLVKDGERVVLIDTGAGGQMGTENKLPASLAAAGVQPAQVTDILISHAHGDHVGGLVANGALVYPNATVRMTAAEWAAMQGENELQPIVRLIRPKVETFEPGASISPAITALPLPGHTAGHTGYEIANGGARLIYVGDALHSSLISVQRPELVNRWDLDSATAIATRQALLERGASQNLLFYGVHFPFPGLGRIQRRDDGFVWAPQP